MSRLQGYENTRHVLEEIRAYHQRLAELYARLMGHATDTRAQMLLEFLHRRELRLVQAMANYEAAAPDKVLLSWFQIPYPEDLNQFSKLLETDEDLSTEQIYRLGTKADSLLITLLEHVENRADTEDVKSVFRDLMAMEKQEQIALSKAMNSFREI